MPEFVPQVVVKLRDEVARFLLYEDNAQDSLPDEPRAEWDAMVAAFPGVPLVLNKIITAVEPESVRVWLDQNENDTGTSSENLLAYFTIPVPGELAEPVASAARLLSFVEHAYVEEAVTLPAINFGDDPLVVGQGYFAPADVGVDAFHVWGLPFSDGSNVRFVDVEFGWKLDHEDLVDSNGVNRVSILPSGTFSTDPDHVRHGTAVLGIVMAADNTKGIVGLAPNVRASVAPVISPAGTQAVAATLAVIGANPEFGSGTVVLLEQQDAQHRPVDADLFVRHTVRELTRKGVTVIEAAGNGFGNGLDLDSHSDIFFGKIFDRNDGAFFDSGAIMVAAAESVVPHTRAIFAGEGSNHGNRIDCFAWGKNILTAAAIVDPATNLPYFATFGGTSGASAIVAGVVVVLQNIRRSVIGDFVSPGQLRDLLRDPEKNTRPAAVDVGRIGVMPNLKNLEPAVTAL